MFLFRNVGLSIRLPMEAEKWIDIDQRDSWFPSYRDFFEGIADQNTWRFLLQSEELTSRFWRLQYLAEKIERGPNHLNQLTDRLRDHLLQHFTHAVLYHACRIRDERTYLTRGLEVSNIDRLNQLAAERFGNTDRLGDAIARIADYSRHGAGRVGLWFSREGAIHEGGHYLEHGSEYLSVLRLDLGLAKHETNEPGRPALIRCLVPLAEMEEVHCRSFAMMPLNEHLTVREPDMPPGFYAHDQAILHGHSIPPGRLSIEFLEAL